MKGLTKRIGVSVVTASLVMSSSLVAFAADPAGTGTSGGTGAIEGIVKTDVYTADLPTESATAYTYIADPQGLIRKTNAAKYDGAVFGEGTLFFTNNGADSTVSYSNTSDALKIVNQSSKNLSVKVAAKATEDASGATLAAAKTFTGTAKEVYLGITDSVAGNGEKALTTTGVEMTAVLGAAPEDAYEYSYVKAEDAGEDGTAGYKYTLKDDVSAYKFAEYSFQITGAANDKATDWAADTALPAISVTWSVDLTDDAATVETPEQTPADDFVMAAEADGSVSYTFGVKPTGTLTKLMVGGSDRSGAITAGNVSYNATTGKITFNSTAANNILGNGATAIVTIGDEDYTLTYTKTE